MKYLIIFALVFIQGILILVHFVVYRALTQLYGSGSNNVSFWIFCFLAFSFTASSLLTHYFNNFFTRFFYHSASIWLGFLFYLSLAAIVYFLVSFVYVTLGRNLDLTSFGQGLVAVALVVSVYGLVNANVIGATYYAVVLKNLPSVWQNKKIVWVSDIHLGQIRSKSFSEKIVQAINQENPELVVIGGDVFDGDKTNLNKQMESFSKIKSVQGTYFITGNHEEFSDKRQFLEAIKKVGIKVLNNEVVDLAGLNLLGVDYQESTNRKKYQEVLGMLNYNRNQPTILLKHVPDELGTAEAQGIDLQISGHAHLAQIWPLSILTRLVYGKYDYGLHDFGQMQVITSSGVGTWGPPLKVGSKPEIVVIKLTNS